MVSDVRDSFSFEEACDELGLEPADLRRMLQKHRGVLRFFEQEPETSAGFLQRDTVANLRLLLGYERDGLDAEQISERMRLRRMSQGETEDTKLAIEALLGRIEAMEESHTESERSYLEDRDRLLMALSRTQQDLKRLENAISVAASRRHRDKALLRRVFDE